MSEVTILVVDDQPELLENIGLTLEAAGYAVLTAETGHHALELLQERPVCLILADIAMPGLNGYQLYQRVRGNAQWLSIPFVFLTARAMDSDVRYGKELGVDDYLTKPIRPEDLLAAVRGKLVRSRQLREATQARAGQASAEQSEIEAGSLKISLREHQVWLKGQPVGLSAKEFKLLAALARNPSRPINPQDLLRETHQLDADADEAGSLIRPLIRSLRRKLGSPVGEMGFIKNVRGVGYKFVPPES